MRLKDTVLDIIIILSVRYGHRDDPIGELLHANHLEPSLQEHPHVLHIRGGIRIDKYVPGPSGFFPLGTIRWYSQKISLLAAEYIGLKPGDVRIAALKVHRRVQPGRHHKPLEIFSPNLPFKPADPHITEPVKGKAGTVGLRTFTAADIDAKRSKADLKRQRRRRTPRLRLK